MRKAISILLLVLAAVLAIPSVALIWVSRDIADESRFVATADRLIEEPAVQTRIADGVTEAVMSHLPVGTLINDAASELPPKAANALTSLTPALDSAVSGYVDKAATALVTSDGFTTVWDGLIKAAHQGLITVLKGDATGDAITVNVGPVVDQVKTKLLDSGLAIAEKIPPVDKQVTLYESPAIGKARVWYDRLGVLKIALPVLTLLLLLGGVLIAKRHWPALMWGALGIAIAMLLLAAATWIARGQLTQGLAVYDAFIPSLRKLVWWVFAGALVLAAAGFILGRRSRPQPASV